jgi:hypothetical protein
LVRSIRRRHLLLWKSLLRLCSRTGVSDSISITKRGDTILLSIHVAL